jgi:hypothetical protein
MRDNFTTPGWLAAGRFFDPALKQQSDSANENVCLRYRPSACLSALEPDSSLE